MAIMVSVICCAYNHEQYIKKCLEGFVMQKTDFDFEVLIHDDASTDGTADMIREYENNYPNIIKPIYQTENQYSKGVMPDRILIEQARGKYVAFCEGDDYWIDQYKLQKQFNIMQRYPKCYMCVHSVQCVREHEEVTNNKYPPFELSSGIVDSTLLIGKYNFQTSSYFMSKKEVVSLYTENPEFSKWATGDVTFLIYFAQLGGVYYIDECLSCYRQDSVGSWVDRRTNKSRIEFHKKMIRTWEEYDIYTSFRFHSLLVESIQREKFNIDLYEKKIFSVFGKKNKKFLKSQKKYYIFLAFFPRTMKFIKILRRMIRQIKVSIKVSI